LFSPAIAGAASMDVVEMIATQKIVTGWIALMPHLLKGASNYCSPLPEGIESSLLLQRRASYNSLLKGGDHGS
jgi:hypothetical protein